MLLAVVLLMGAAVIMVPLFKKLGLGTVLGYLAAGTIVGPWGFGVTTEVDALRHFSEFGVVFLLFIIGLELHPRKLWDMRGSVFGLGSAQIVVTAALAAGVSLWRGQPFEAAVLIGAGIALSSTAIVLQILSEKGEMQTTAGQGTFSILLMQDIAVVPLLAAVPLLADGADIPTPDPLWAVISIVGTVLGTKYLLIPAIGLVAKTRNQDIFGAAAVLAVLVAALVMEFNHLSMALGAFLVGLTLSDCEYRHQIEADVRPFKGYLLGLFFMSIGMTLDFGIVYNDFAQIMGMLILIFALKTIVLFVLGKIWRYNTRDSLRMAFLLSQCGEFGFVLFGLMLASGLISQGLFQGLLVFVALTMVIAPFWEKLGNLIIKRVPEENTFTDLGQSEIMEEKPKALIAGFGRFGQSIARMMQDMDVPYVAVEFAPQVVSQARANGYHVVYGDVTRPDFLQSLGVDVDTVIVITLGDTKKAKKIVETLHAWHPGIDILSRAHNLRAREELLRMDVTEAVPETLEASLRLGEIALWRVGADFDKIAGIIRQARQDGYAVIRNETFRSEEKPNDK
jgi:monovalent cation:proton antiporter-2 (CPA2) family protein